MILKTNLSVPVTGCKQHEESDCLECTPDTHDRGWIRRHAWPIESTAVRFERRIVFIHDVE
jgi:hypothetical protein